MRQQKRETEFLQKIGELIEVPRQDFFIDKPDCFEFKYTYLGSCCVAKVEKPFEAAALLFQYNKIIEPQVKGSEVLMQSKVFHIVFDQPGNGSFTQQEATVPFEFSQATFTPEEARAICTQKHFAAASSQAGEVIEKMLQSVLRFGIRVLKVIPC